MAEQSAQDRWAAMFPDARVVEMDEATAARRLAATERLTRRIEELTGQRQQADGTWVEVS